MYKLDICYMHFSFTKKIYAQKRHYLISRICNYFRLDVGVSPIKVHSMQGNDEMITNPSMFVLSLNKSIFNTGSNNYFIERF